MKQKPQDRRYETPVLTRFGRFEHVTREGWGDTNDGFAVMGKHLEHVS